MASPAIVVVAYKIPKTRVRDFVAWNSHEITAAKAYLFVVCEEATADSSEEALWELGMPLACPSPMSIFSLCRAANYGIRCAVEERYSPILKTDIDVVFDGQLQTLLAVDEKTANAPKYLDCPSYAKRREARGILPKGQGSICMTADNWRLLQGYDERFVGWGGDDNEMCARIKERGIRLNDDMKVCHIAHEVNTKWNREFNPRNWHNNQKLKIRPVGSQPCWGMGQ